MPRKPRIEKAGFYHIINRGAKYRDYYDLYFLTKESMSIKNIFKVSETVVVGVTFKLFAVALVYIDDIEDDDISYLEPKEKISKTQMRKFFEKRL